MKKIAILFNLTALIFCQLSRADIRIDSFKAPQVLRTDLTITGLDAVKLLSLFKTNSNSSNRLGVGETQFSLDINSKNRLTVSVMSDLTMIYLDCRDIRSTPSCALTVQYQTTIGGVEGLVRGGSSNYVSARLSEEMFSGIHAAVQGNTIWSAGRGAVAPAHGAFFSTRNLIFNLDCYDDVGDGGCEFLIQLPAAP